MKTVEQICLEHLDGKTAVKIPYNEENAKLLESSVKTEALNGGFVIIANPSDKTIMIKSYVGMRKSREPQQEAIEKPDPNVPFSGFYVPAVADDVIRVLKAEKTSNIWLYGPTQCGKSTIVRYIGHKLGRKVETINCKGDMDSHHFFGNNTIVNGEIVFKKGCVEKSMTEGLDEDGNVVGEPGILFVDEAAAMPTEIAIGLNNTLETGSNVRKLTLPEDGNRVVHSHPGWRVIFAGNNNGTGAQTMSDQLYTAQRCALDASLLQRMSMMVRMGYDKKAEERIIRVASQDDDVVETLLRFKQGVRDALKRGELTTPFSTKRVIDIMDMYEVFRDVGRNTKKVRIQTLGKAIYYAAYEILALEEKSKYDELWFPLTGERIGAWSPISDSDTDYM